MKKTTVIGFLGTTLDNSGWGNARWERWRPTVSLCQHEELLIDRYDLLYQTGFVRLMELTRQDIALVSPETEVVPHEVTLQNPWDFEEVFGLLHDFSSRYSFEQDDYLIHITTGSHVAQICLFLLAEARYFPGRLIQSGPGRGRVAVPSGTYSIIDLDLSRYDRIATRFSKERSDDISFLKSGIQTRNKEFNDLIAQIEQVALQSPDPLLLAGPTGAGKSRLAKRIFELKKARRRIEGSFVEVNCATLRGENAMSALFGHKKGAFTGAITSRAGLLKIADKGVLFLDEIGELGLDEQAMLLRAVEEKSFLPLGSDKEENSNFQLICGSNKNLKKECLQGAFREDLLARINLWTFVLPGLAERVEDIEPNFDYEIEQFSMRMGRRITINKEARKKFLQFAVSSDALWTSNFRDLGGAVTRMATLAPHGRITVYEVTDEISRLKDRWTVHPAENREIGDFQELTPLLDSELLATIDQFDQATLDHVIRICRQSTTLAEAGRMLFNVSRSRKKVSNDSDRLRKYLARFDLTYQMVK